MSGSELRIRTPEGIAFAYQLAGPVTRCLAWAIDIFCIIILVLAAAMVIGRFAFFDPDLAGGLGRRCFLRHPARLRGAPRMELARARPWASACSRACG